MPARIPQVPPNAERAPFHYLDCTRVQFVSKKPADERDGWIAIGRIGQGTRTSGGGKEQSGGGRRTETQRLAPRDPDESTREDEETMRRQEEKRALKDGTDRPWAWLIISFMTGHLVGPKL